MTSAALAFEPVTGRVAAGASAPDVSGAALAVGMAAPEGADLRSSAAAVSASSGVVEPLRTPPVLSATPGSDERVAACRDVDITRLVGEPVDVSVDPDLADGGNADAPDTEAVPAGVASCDDELKPDGAVAFVDDEDPGADDLDAADEDGPESEGSADATQGVAASPAPMPSATANAATRPVYLAYPMRVPFPRPASPGRGVAVRRNLRRRHLYGRHSTIRVVSAGPYGGHHMDVPRMRPDGVRAATQHPLPHP